MAFISSGVEYALHCLLYLTHPINASGASVRDLAELQKVPNDYLSKIFTKLHKAKIVVASEGIKGGFSLAKNADEITVHDVIIALDDYKPLFQCKEIRARCTIFKDNPPEWATSGMCAIHKIMYDAEKQLRHTLSQQTLGNIARQFHHKAPSDYQQQIIQWLDTRINNR